MRPWNALRRDWFTILLAELTVTNVGFFAVLAMVAAYVSKYLQFSAVETSAVMLASTFGLRFTRTLVAPWVDQVDPRKAIPFSIVLSALGYLGLAYFTTPLSVGACLLLAGMGYGTNGLLVTTLGSHVKEGGALRRYTVMNIGTNIAAASGPLIANALMEQVHPAAPFVFAGGVLCISVWIALNLLKINDLPSIRSEGGWLRSAKFLVCDPPFLWAMLLTVLGWFLYTQKFSAIPLYLTHALGKEAWIGALVAMNALIIIVLSMPASKWLTRHGFSPAQVIASGYCLYGLAYLFMFCFDTFEGIVAGVVMTSLAEGLLMPALNANVAERTLPQRRLAAFSLAAIAIGIGEGAGNVTGVTLVSYFTAMQHPAMTFLVLAACATPCLALALMAGKAAPFRKNHLASPHIQPAEETV